MWGVNSASVMLSWCQSIAVSWKGGLSRGKGSAVGSGLDFQVAWKVEGWEERSMVWWSIVVGCEDVRVRGSEDNGNSVTGFLDMQRLLGWLHN